MRWLQKTITDPPEYRFQAVQDGDRASLAGQYDKALGFYQQAIFDDKLEGWSRAQRDYVLQVHFDQEDGTATPVETRPPLDPAEYPALAAYARYRIMLLHVVQGHLSDAKVVYDTLQAKFPEGQHGYIQAELATAFWKRYAMSGDIGDACNAAIEYTQSNSIDILFYLGNNSQYGSQNLAYTPETVCPFQ